MTKMRGTKMRGTWWLSMVAGLLMCGCPQSVGGPPDGGLAGVDEGNWQDTGRLASCQLAASSASVACGDLESFDLGGCDVSSLGRLPPGGVYTLQHRYDGATGALSPSALRVSEPGKPGAYRGQPLEKETVGVDTFYLSSTRTSGTQKYRYALAGCQAQDERRLTGCFIMCRNGSLYGSGTFQAVRWQRREGEAESSNMQLVAEAPVTQGLPVDVYVTKGHAYVVSVTNGSAPGGLTVFDVSDPRAPVWKKTLSFAGDKSYWNGVWAKGDALYVASSTMGLMLYDITQPAEPLFVKNLPASTQPVDVHTVFVERDRLYAMEQGPELRALIFDVSVPLEPVPRGSYMEPGVDPSSFTFPHDAFAFEGRLYINHWAQGLLITDVTNPLSVKKLGDYRYAYSTSHASAVGRMGDRIIAFEGGEDWGAHLRVLDVTDAASPKRIGEFRLDANASIHNMVLKGTRLYVAWYQHGVRVLDVSRPEQPEQVAYYNTYTGEGAEQGHSFYEGAIGMRVPGDGYVYVVDITRGLLVFPEP